MPTVGPIIFTYSTTDFIPVVTTLTLNPVYCQIVQPRYMPIQKINIAESGHLWVYELSSAVELELTMDITDLPTSNQTAPLSAGGYNNLYSFLASTVVWSKNAFTMRTADGDDFVVRYLRGFDSLREASGRTQRADFWTGALTFWRAAL